MKVQEGKFKLQDLLVVPMQRVLKYHLLLKVGSRVVNGNVSRESALLQNRFELQGVLLLVSSLNVSGLELG